jgi:hypothetical protein
VWKNEAGGRNRSFVGCENMWVTALPMIDPMMPSTIVQKIACAMHHRFRDDPAINPTKYQISES